MGRLKIHEFINNEYSLNNIQDSTGQNITITDSVDKNNIPNKIIVVLEATHTGVNKNHVEYTMNSLETSASTWTKDFEKPVLLNHNVYSDPLGRVKNAKYRQSIMDSNKYCIELTVEITNKDAIERFLDGRYKTFSIGGSTDSATCSVCGKDVAKDGWCGHSRGRMYDNKKCYWTFGEMSYDEISVVNTPADPNAQAIDITVIEENEGKNGCDNSQTNASSIVSNDNSGNMLPIIDGLLGIQNQGTPEPPVIPSTDNTEDIETLKESIRILEAKNASLLGEISQFDIEVKELQAKNTELDTAVLACKQDVEDSNKLNVSLAKMVHRASCQRAVDIQLTTGVIIEDDKERLLQEYASYTSVQIEDLINETLKAHTVLQKTKVEHPATQQIEDSTSTQQTSKQKDDVTMIDFIDQIFGFKQNL